MSMAQTIRKEKLPELWPRVLEVGSLQQPSWNVGWEGQREAIQTKSIKHS